MESTNCSVEDLIEMQVRLHCSILAAASGKPASNKAREAHRNALKGLIAVAQREYAAAVLEDVAQVEKMLR